MSRIFRAAVTDTRPVLIEIAPDSVTHVLERAVQQSDDICSKKQEPTPQQILQQARLKAKRLLEDAEQESQRLVEQAVGEADSIRRQAAEQGYREGLEQGRQQAYQLIKQAEELKLQIANEKKEYLRSADQQIMELAVEIAGHIVKQNIEQDFNTLLPMIQAAIKEIVSAERVVIKVSPASYETIIGRKEELERELPPECELLIVASPDCDLCDCMVHTESAEIDATLTNALAKIRAALQEVLPA